MQILSAELKPNHGVMGNDDDVYQYTVCVYLFSPVLTLENYTKM